MFDEGKGDEHAHRVLILQVEEEGVGLDGKTTAKIDLKPMTIGVTEDGSFLNYRTANDEEIREALGLSEVFFKSIKLTKASAVVAKATTDEQEFEPARKQKEHIMNQRLVWGPQGLGATRVKLQFQRPETSDPLERARVDDLYSKMAALTPNEIRIKLGLDPYPPEQKWANWPMPVLLMALEGKADSGLIDYEPEPDEQPEGEPPPTDEDEDEDEEAPEDGDEEDEDEEEATQRSSGSDPLATTQSVANGLRTLPARGKLGNLEPELKV